MSSVVKQIMDQLPEAAIELNESNLKKIYNYIPVPTDYEILWADIGDFGGYPSGIVITEQALIIKSSKAEVKEYNKAIKDKNKEVSKEEKADTLKEIYQIIPWEYYSPEEYSVSQKKDSNGNISYAFKAGKSTLARFTDVNLYKAVCKYSESLMTQQKVAVEIIENSTFSAVNTINIEGTAFNAAYGADQTKTGHGIYAEEAGAILDKLNGEKSTVVGRDNAKNGPDKIVDATPVQCKYYQTACNSIGSCFTKDPITGERVFRYLDLTGEPMKVEVASDQYLQAVQSMKNRINKGQVPGVSDPNVAYDIVRKGRLTYKQALNLAKAGTVESISFDAKTGAVNCLSALGISSVAAFAQIFWTTKDYKKAAKGALLAGIQVYGMSFAGSILASQLSRTGVTKAIFTPAAKFLSEKLPQKTVQDFINAFRALAGKKAIYGTAAQKSFAKVLGSNALTESVMFLVFSVPDTYRVITGKMSGAQYTKNMLSLVMSFLGSIAGAAAVGALIGQKAGEEIDEKAGATIGLVAGGTVGLVAGTTTKIVFNLIREDDAVITTRLFNAVLTNLFFDNMLSGEEQIMVMVALGKESKKLNKLQQSLVKSSTQSEDIIKFMSPIIDDIIGERNKITSDDEAMLEEEMEQVVFEGGLEYGM